MSTDQQRNKGIMLAFAAALVSGVAVFVNGLAVRRFDDATVYTTAKNLIAGVILAIALLATTTVASVGVARTVPRSALPKLAVIALVGGAVPFVLFFEGLARATRPWWCGWRSAQRSSCANASPPSTWRRSACWCSAT
jgi:drug/metabolite transporter (DMT)-like permease